MWAKERERDKFDELNDRLYIVTSCEQNHHGLHRQLIYIIGIKNIKNYTE